MAPSPSGKAPDSDSGIRRFESFLGGQIQPVLPRSAGSVGQAGNRKPASSGLARFRQAGPCRPRHPDPRRLSMVAIFSAPFTPADALLPAMRGHGYAVLGPDAVAGLGGVAVADLDTLKPSWDRSEEHTYELQALMRN